MYILVTLAVLGMVFTQNGNGKKGDLYVIVNGEEYGPMAKDIPYVKGAEQAFESCIAINVLNIFFDSPVSILVDESLSILPNPFLCTAKKNIDTLLFLIFLAYQTDRFGL